MIFNGPFTDEEKMYLEEGFDNWIVWKQSTSETHSLYYAYRTDWPKSNRIVLRDFKEFVIALDEQEGYYPRNENAKDRFTDKKSIFCGSIIDGQIVLGEHPDDPPEPPQTPQPVARQKWPTSAPTTYRNLRIPDVDP